MVKSGQVEKQIKALRRLRNLLGDPEAARSPELSKLWATLPRKRENKKAKFDTTLIALRFDALMNAAKQLSKAIKAVRESGYQMPDAWRLVYPFGRVSFTRDAKGKIAEKQITPPDIEGAKKMAREIQLRIEDLQEGNQTPDTSPRAMSLNELGDALCCDPRTARSRCGDGISKLKGAAQGWMVDYSKVPDRADAMAIREYLNAHPKRPKGKKRKKATSAK